MKRKTAALAAVPALLLLLAACGAHKTSTAAQQNAAEAAATEPAGSYVPDFQIRLEPVGRGVKWSKQLADGKNGTQRVLSPLRQDVLGTQYDSVEPLQTDGGLYYIVYDGGNTPNPRGLVSEDCELLLPCEAAIIRQKGGSASRYLEVVYAAGSVSSEDDAFLTGVGDPDGNTLYAGYARYYDLQTRQFVPGVENSDVNVQVSVVGDNLFFRDLDRDLGAVYRPDGSLAGEFSGVASGEFFVGAGTADMTHGVYNAELEHVRNLTFWPADVYAGASLFAVPDGGGFCVVNADGAKVSELRFACAPDQYGGYLCGSDAGGNCAAIDLSGRTVLSFSDGVRYVSPMAHGLVMLEYADGSRALLYPNGDISCRCGQNGFPFWQRAGDGYRVFILADEAFTLNVANADWIEAVGSFAVAVRGADSGLYTLYSVIDGTQLLDGQYGDVHVSGSYLYVQEAGGCRVYRMEQ